MALFEDEEFTEEGAENNYLIDPEKGLELVRSMILRQKSRPGDISFDTIIKQKLFPTLAELGLKREAEIYSQLNKLSDKLKDGEKLRLLYQKKVVGIGGKFSAGKSCFINSLTNSTLPEGQRPTTSIATYIVHADAKKNVAITNNDNLIELDDEA
ncbi:MAG: dynamin family protein, partial [Clostridia bacterium]|nr:dynamin family protein [Clostridia bacterium]